MKINKILLVSMILLAILTFGAASAAEDVTVDNVTVADDGGSVEISSSVDEVEVSGDIALEDSSSDNAIDSDVKSVKNYDSKLSTSDSNDLLGEDYEVITQDEFMMRGWNDRIMSGNYKLEGEFNGLPDYIFVDSGSIIDATGAKFIDTGIILVEPDIQITGLTIEVTKHLIDDSGYVLDGTVLYMGATDNIKLDGMTIDYAPTDDDHDAFAVVIDNTMDFELKNSEITLNGSSLYDNYEYAMKIMGATNGLIEENIIRANLPILDVDYGKGNPGLDTDLVLTVGVQEANDIDFIGNTFIANVIDRNGNYATLDCMMIENSNNINIIGNTFNETDFFTQEGENNYLNVLDIYYTSNVLIQGNRISVETTGGSENAGTSYPIQLTGPYENVLIDGNDIYSNCAGPALGIYSQNYYGDTEITVINNNIDVTGLPTHNPWGLVSGIELQDNVARVYNNTITTRAYNGFYEDGMNLYGISYAQSLNDNHQYDIRDNTIITEGQYAIYLLKAADTVITGNSLSAERYQGDEAIYIEEAEGSLDIRDNYGRNAFYVSEFGDDYAEGTEDAPFATIERALMEIPKSGIIYLLEGTIELTQNIQFDKSISFIAKDPKTTSLNMNGFTIWATDVSLDKIEFDGINFTNMPEREAFIFAGAFNKIIFENCIFNINSDHEIFILDGQGGDFTFKNNAFINQMQNPAVPLITVYSGEYNLNVNNNILNSLIAVTNIGSGSVDLDYNYWGTNNFKEIELRGFDIENIKNIVIANISVSPANEIYAGSQANITVDFNNYFDILNEQYGTKNNLIPDEITVQFKADGNLGDEYVTIENGKATTTYVNDEIGTDEVMASIPYQELSEKISIVEMPEFEVKADNTLLGQTTTIYVTAPGQTGTVEIKVNGKTIAAPVLNDGTVTQTVDADDIVAGVNNVEVIVDDVSYTTTFTAVELDGIVTNETFFRYFNASNSYRLCDYIPEGMTLDFRGYFNSTSEVSYVMEINKPINMISTTKDAFINLNTISTDFSGQNPGDRFTVSFNGSGTNISDITFYNSQLWFTNTHNLTMNNITSIVEDRELGSGVGVTAFRGGSSHITVTNSYFSTKDNGGHSNFVLSDASYVTVDNCTIKGQGMIGNLIYLNLYNLDLPDGMYLSDIMIKIRNGEMTINDHNTFTNCKVYGPDNAMAICNTFREMGSGSTTIVNTTFVYENNGNGVAIIGGVDMVLNNVTVIGGSTVSTGARSVVVDSNFDGPVTIAGSTEFSGNTLMTTLTAGGSNNITDNHIETTEDYAITLSGSNNKVSDNYLVSASKKGDEAVNIGSGTDNVVQNNLPLDVDIVLDVQYDSIWLGNENIATVTINDATGSVEIKVNGKTIAAPELDNGVATQTISASDIKGGENTVEATYMGVTATQTFYVYGVVTNETYGIYFNESDSGRLSEFVPEGATLDFQGKFLSSADQLYVMDINKPVNIITSTNDAYIDLNTTAGSYMGDNPGNRFTVSNGGSGSNITGIRFHNTQLWIDNTHNVVLDNISNVIEDQRVGSGVGATSIRNNSTYVTVKNSYFYTKNNGGSSSLVIAWADYCTFDNNTVEVEGNVGNLIYLTTFNVDVPAGVIANQHNNITNNIVHRVDSGNYAICWGIVVGGANNLIENNTIMLNKGTGITSQYGGATGAENNTYKGNKLYSASLNALPNSIVCDNYVEGSTISVAAGGEAYNNTIVDGTLTLTNAAGHDNNVDKVIVDGENASVSGTVNNLDVKSNVNMSGVDVTGTLRFIGSNSVVSDSTVNNVLFGVDRSTKSTSSELSNSTVTGTVTFNTRSDSNILKGNDISNLVTVNSNQNVITENTIVTAEDYAVKMDYTSATGNNVSNNYLVSKDKTANSAIVNLTGKNHIIENNGPDLVLEDIPDSLIGDTSVNVTVLPTFRNTTLTIKVNDKVINETEVSGTVEQVINATDLIIGENTVEVTAYGITKTTTFNVYEIIIDVADNNVMLGNDNNVVVSIPEATGDISIKVNGVEIATPILSEGTATAVIPAENIVYGENTVEVTYNGFTNSTTFNGITNIVTQENFFDFFDEDGFLLSDMPFDELIFQGNFNDLVEMIYIERPLTITGDNAVLNNIPFYIISSDVVLDNLTLVADMDLESLILVESVEDVNLTNLNITYTPEVGEGAVAVNIIESNNVRLVDSEIFFESHVTSDKYLSVAIQIQDTQDVVVDNNNVTTKLPCVYVDTYDEDYYMMGSNNVNPVRLKNCENLKFTNNNINSTTNDFSASFPTIQSIYIIGCSDSLIDHNNISMIDEKTPSGMDNYMYGINFGHNSNVTFSYNNFNMYTSGGKDAAGTNYAFQGVESDVIIKGNNITSKSYGPNLGIYVASMFGEDSNLLIEDNFINVTGYASPSGTWALVSGIEIQNGNARIYNNTIYTYNVNEYDEFSYMYGISYAQWMYGTRAFDIQNNTIYTEGKYTISVLDADYVHATGNTLYAHELAGDDSINPGSCDDVLLSENIPAKAEIIIDVEDCFAGNDNNVTITVVNMTGNVTVKVNGKDVAVEQVLVDNEFNYVISASDLVIGENTIEVTFNGADKVMPTTNSTTFNVTQAGSSVTIDPVDDVVYGSPVVITFDIVNETDFVTVSVSDVNDPDKLIEYEYADGTITVNDLPVGDYIVNIHNGENDLYTESEANATFSVIKANSSVTIDPVDDVVYGSPVVITFDIVNETDFVTISVSDVNDPDKLIEYEYADGSITVNDLPVGDYIVNIHNGENDLYTESEANATFSVIKAGTILTADDLIMNYKDGSDWTVTLTDANGEAISDATVGIGINGKVYNVKTDANGNAGLVINLAPGTHAINATFDETSIYEGAFTNATITVNKGETTLSASDLVMSYKDGSAWEVTLTDANGNAISGVNVVFGIKGSNYNAKTDDTGVAKLPMNLAPGTYDINATFAGSNKYEQSFVNATVTINKATVVLSAVDLVMNYKDGSAWVVTLTDADGNAISGVNIAIGIKGSTYNVKTNDTGVAKLPINLAIGTYEISAALNNGYYEAESIQANVTVNKAAATLTADDLEMSYKDGSAYSVNVVDANGAAVVNAVVKFTIGTSNYNIKTDANGVASLPISLYLGEYDVTATLNDANYQSEAVSNTITVKDYDAELVASDINMTYKDGTAYEVQLTDSEGNNITVANLVVKITIKGSTYNIKTDANGIAKLPINLYVGTYDISAEYNGKEVTNTIVVNKA